MLECDEKTQSMRIKEAPEEVCLTAPQIQGLVRGGYFVGFGVCAILFLVGIVIYSLTRKK